MRYRRALCLLDAMLEAAPTLSVLRRAAPQLDELLILAAPEQAPLWPFAEAKSGLSAPDVDGDARVQALRAAAAGAARSVEVQLSPQPPSAALSALCIERNIELLVLPASLRAAASMLLQRRRPPVAVLWARSVVEAGEQPIRKLGCVALDSRAIALTAAFARDYADPANVVALLSSRPMTQQALTASLELSGIAAPVEASAPGQGEGLRDFIEHWIAERSLELLVFARAPSALLLGSTQPLPVLLLPPLPAAAPVGRRPLDVADVLETAGMLRARVDQVSPLGGIEPLPDQPLALVAGGRTLQELAVREGDVQLPAALATLSVGLYRVREARSTDPLLAIEEQVALVRPSGKPLVLYDAALSTAALHSLAELRPEHELLAVRLRPTRACRAIRQRLRAAGLPAFVLDARAVLDEGDALDVSEPLDALRLARAARRLSQAGLPIAAMVYRGTIAPSGCSFAVLSERELGAGQAWPVSPPIAADSSSIIAGNALELELDNARARRWLLELIAYSQHTLHIQVYMAMDDEIGSAVCTALAEAGARGVKVRVLVDSLHGLHGSFGVKNPLLERLAAQPAVELRTVHPITELPSLADLKQRDHRKLVIADGCRALLGGRNLSHEYYTGFEEVPLTAASDWRALPWLDAGARVTGPVVRELQRAFRDAWVEAGGASFELSQPTAAGLVHARAVVHRGLRDASTLETYLSLFAAARFHIYVVNGFPLALELQHALLGALQRGVRVRVLLGHVTPIHGSRPFSGSWSTARNAATELVHSRIDPLVNAGAEVYLFALRDVPGWSEDLGTVYPHVHAKAVSVDGARCALGSANLDITAAYWESELLLVAEDAAIACGFETQVDALMAASTRLRSDDPQWQEQAKRRAWMRHWPGVLSV